MIMVLYFYHLISHNIYEYTYVSLHFLYGFNPFDVYAYVLDIKIVWDTMMETSWEKFGIMGEKELLSTSGHEKKFSTWK